MFQVTKKICKYWVGRQTKKIWIVAKFHSHPWKSHDSSSYWSISGSFLPCRCRASMQMGTSVAVIVQIDISFGLISPVFQVQNTQLISKKPKQWNTHSHQFIISSLSGPFLGTRCHDLQLQSLDVDLHSSLKCTHCEQPICDRCTRFETKEIPLLALSMVNLKCYHHQW